MKTNYFVTSDVKLPNGGTLLHARFSRPIERVGVLRRVLKRVRRHEPTAYAVQEKHYR